ncbi:MAG: lysylphosphatidylglycerol synthase transmembrane domain-containing protein [Actinomycetota bacterium]
MPPAPAVDTCDLPGSTRRAVWVRRVGVVALLVVLIGAIVLRRETVVGALTEIGGLPVVAIALLVLLAGYERWSRADITARLLGPMRTRDGFVVHDVGNAVSKGVPMGGALGTALRWSIVRDRDVSPARFSTMLIAYGVATTFMTWLLPTVALLVDLVGRRMTATDGILLLVMAVAMIGQLLFWYVVLGSDRVERWSSRLVGGACARVARRLPALGDADAEQVVVDVRRALRVEARRAAPLLVRTALAQATGALILLVSLRSLGVGGELGTTEFFRLFFVTHLLGTFAPTPGGVGVVEAGLSGALVAAGVDPTTALAGVLVYRFLTYVLPIATGTILYVVWRRNRRGLVPHASERLEPCDTLDTVPSVDVAAAVDIAAVDVGAADVAATGSDVASVPTASASTASNVLTGDLVDDPAGVTVDEAPVRRATGPAATLSAHGASILAELPDLPRTAHQGIRQRVHPLRDDRPRFVGRRWAPDQPSDEWTRAVS